MNRFLLLALTAVALVGCQCQSPRNKFISTPRNKYISRCASKEGMEFFNLTRNEWKKLCTCQYELMMEEDTTPINAAIECRKKLKVGVFKE